MCKNEDEAEIGEEFEGDDGYMYIKLPDDRKAPIWDENTHDWKVVKKLDS